MPIRNILAAFDFSEPATRAVLWAADLARTQKAELHVVHVHPDLYDGRGQAELGLPWPSEGQEERYMRFLDQEVRRAVQGAVGPEAALSVHVVRGDPVKRTIGIAQEVHADLICTGATGKGAAQRMLLGSVSERLLRSAHLPVLIVH
jgi:nucleotide-binding universal stress UspA family protein